MSFNKIIKKHLKAKEEAAKNKKSYKFRENVFDDVYNLALTEAGVVSLSKDTEKLIKTFGKLMFEYGQKYEKNF